MLPEISRILKTGGFTTRLECLLVLSNVAAGTMSQVETLINESFVKAFVMLINNPAEPPRLRREACWGLANMTSHRIPSQISAITSEDAIRILVQFLSSTDEHASTGWKVVQCLVNIVESADDPNAKYAYTRTPLIANQYVEYLKENPDLLTSLLKYLELLEDNIESKISEPRGSSASSDEPSPNSSRERTVELLKLLFSKRFRDYYVPYCHHREKINEVYHSCRSLIV